MAIQLSQRLGCAVLRRNVSADMHGNFFSMSEQASLFVRNTGNQLNSATSQRFTPSSSSSSSSPPIFVPPTSATMSAAGVVATAAAAAGVRLRGKDRLGGGGGAGGGPGGGPNSLSKRAAEEAKYLKGRKRFWHSQSHGHTISQLDVNVTNYDIFITMYRIGNGIGLYRQVRGLKSIYFVIDMLI